MDRADYNKCLSPWIKGTGIDKEERKLRFCIGAKICSQKCSTEEEARAICLLPKPEKEPKASKRRGSKANCETDMANVAQCLVGKISSSTTADDIINILVKCHCKKKPTKMITVAGLDKLPDYTMESIQNEYGTAQTIPSRT